MSRAQCQKLCSTLLAKRWSLEQWKQWLVFGSMLKGMHPRYRQFQFLRKAKEGASGILDMPALPGEGYSLDGEVNKWVGEGDRLD